MAARHTRWRLCASCGEAKATVSGAVGQALVLSSIVWAPFLCKPAAQECIVSPCTTGETRGLIRALLTNLLQVSDRATPLCPSCSSCALDAELLTKLGPLPHPDTSNDPKVLYFLLGKRLRMFYCSASDQEHVPQARAQQCHHARGDCSTSRGATIGGSDRSGTQPTGPDGSRLVRLWQRPREAAASAYAPSAIGSGPNPSATATETNVAATGNQQSTQPQASRHQAAGQ